LGYRLRAVQWVIFKQNAIRSALRGEAILHSCMAHSKGVFNQHDVAPTCSSKIA
jgi:hypothetical protein